MHCYSEHSDGSLVLDTKAVFADNGHAIAVNSATAQRGAFSSGRSPRTKRRPTRSGLRQSRPNAELPYGAVTLTVPAPALVGGGTSGQSEHMTNSASAEDAGVTPGERALRDDGYRFVIPVDSAASAFDGQGHLNNAGVDQIFNDLRVAYMINAHPELGRSLGERGYVVAVRETHILFESQGMPDDRFVGGTRIEGRRGRAQIAEQRIVEDATGRPIARAWLVHLLLRDGRVVDWPDGYWERVAELEGRAMPSRPRITAAPSGRRPQALSAAAARAPHRAELPICLSACAPAP
jgi:acyl-CoA thioesterase FadM